MQMKQDWHIHTYRSLCAKPENTVSAIVDVLDKGQMKLAGLADHINAPNERRWFRGVIQRNREDLAELHPQCRIMVGTEASMNSPEACSLGDELAAELDFVIVACNHYHLDCVENPTKEDAASYAPHYLDMVSGAAALGYADSISHPFILLKSSAELRTSVLAHYDETRLSEVLREAAEADMAFEVNPNYCRGNIEWFRDLVQEARRQGTKFTLGTDSHTLDTLNFPNNGEVMNSKAVCDAIGLTAEDLKWPAD